MPRRIRSSADILAEISTLKDQLRKAEEREAARIGAIAIKAKLHEVEIADHDLLTAFAEIGARFRQAANAENNNKAENNHPAPDQPPQ